MKVENNSVTAWLKSTFALSFVPFLLLQVRICWNALSKTSRVCVNTNCSLWTSLLFVGVPLLSFCRGAHWCHHIPQVDVPSYFVGLILENFQLSHANYGHVFLADPLPLVFYPISSTEVRCLVDAPGQRVPFISNGEMSKYLKTVVGPQVMWWWKIFFSLQYHIGVCYYFNSMAFN